MFETITETYSIKRQSADEWQIWNTAHKVGRRSTREAAISAIHMMERQAAEAPAPPAPEAKTPAVEEVKEEAVITQDMYAALRYAPSPRGARIHRGGSCHGCGLPLNRRGECDECGYMG